MLHPASTTHQQLNEDQLRAGGVDPDLVRISVGLEDVDDVFWDLDQALERATGRDRDGTAGRAEGTPAGAPAGPGRQGRSQVVPCVQIM